MRRPDIAITSCDDIVMIISQRILYRHRIDVATMTRIFQIKFNFYVISILRRHVIATTCCDDIVMIISQRILYRHRIDVATMTRIFSKKNSIFMQYRFYVVTSSPQPVADDCDYEKSNFFIIFIGLTLEQ